MANTITYISTGGVTAPTADQNRTHQSMVAEITGDGAATSTVIVHNWGLSTAEQAAKYPYITLLGILAAFNTAVPFVASQDANSVTITNVAFSGKAIRVILERPYSQIR